MSVFLNSQLPISIPLDDQWVSHNEQGITEFFLKHESPNNWTEWITVHYFKAPNLDLGELSHSFYNAMRQGVKSNQFFLKIWHESEDDILGEWSIEGTTQDQQELIRFMKNQENVAIVRYSTKISPLSDEKHHIWKQILKNTTFQS